MKSCIKTGRRPRIREVKALAQGHTAEAWQWQRGDRGRGGQVPGSEPGAGGGAPAGAPRPSLGSPLPGPQCGSGPSPNTDWLLGDPGQAPHPCASGSSPASARGPRPGTSEPRAARGALVSSRSREGRLSPAWLRTGRLSAAGRRARELASCAAWLSTPPVALATAQMLLPCPSSSFPVQPSALRLLPRDCCLGCCPLSHLAPPPLQLSGWLCHPVSTPAGWAEGRGWTPGPPPELGQRPPPLPHPSRPRNVQKCLVHWALRRLICPKPLTCHCPSPLLCFPPLSHWEAGT